MKVKNCFGFFLIVVILMISVKTNDANRRVFSENTSVLIPIEISFENTYSIDLNIRINKHIVDDARVISHDEILDNALMAWNLDSDRLKIGIASGLPLTFQGSLIYLQLDLSREQTIDDELWKIVQIKLNGNITYQAENLILLSGVREGISYDNPIFPNFNEGTATLNGNSFESGSKIEIIGNYKLSVIDTYGKTRTIQFSIVPPASQYLLGDVNGDRRITTVDALMALQKASGRITLTDLQKFTADVNKDGMVTTVDALIILQYVSGRITTFGS